MLRDLRCSDIHARVHLYPYVYMYKYTPSRYFSAYADNAMVSLIQDQRTEGGVEVGK